LRSGRGRILSTLTELLEGPEEKYKKVNDLNCNMYCGMGGLLSNSNGLGRVRLTLIPLHACKDIAKWHKSVIF
jgi:hypothetical protein